VVPKSRSWREVPGLFHFESVSDRLFEFHVVPFCECLISGNTEKRAGTFHLRDK
jgi:hypothetical protein